MPNKWTSAREKRLVRRADGTFKVWTGGKKLSELKKTQNNFHGTRVHVGLWFKKWTGRSPKVGDTFRMRLQDGRPHPGAAWYVYTPHGWRDSGQTTRPSARRIADMCLASRPSRSGVRPKKG